MTSADFLQFVVTTEFFSACKTSSGKNNHLHLIYLPYLHIEVRAVLGFVLCWKLVRFNMPYIRFLFVRPRLCLQLLSDSVSRRTPLSLANSSYCQVCSGLPPPSDLLMPSTQYEQALRKFRSACFCFIFSRVRRGADRTPCGAFYRTGIRSRFPDPLCRLSAAPP